MTDVRRLPRDAKFATPPLQTLSAATNRRLRVAGELQCKREPQRSRERATVRTLEAYPHPSYHRTIARLKWLKGHRARIRAGRARAVDAGGRGGSAIPYGLHYTTRTEARILGREPGWSIDPDAGPIVREIFTRGIAGESCWTIAQDLDVRGVVRPSKGGNARKRWSRGTVNRLVTTRYVLGELETDTRRHVFAHGVPRFVDDATFNAAWAALQTHQKRGLSHTRHVYLVERIGICGTYGSPITIQSWSSVARRVPNRAKYV
jgi:hypothetical protein